MIRVIYGPDGTPLCEKPAPDAEGLLYADIDLGTISVAKAAADPAGHYSRPDVTRLLLNNAANKPVQTLSPAAAEVNAIVPKDIPVIAEPAE